MQPLSFSGDIWSAGISQDGRFVCFVRNNALWVRQVSAAPGERDIQLAESVAGRTYQHPTFTPNGQHVDFTVIEGESRELWRVPLFGGAPQRIARNVWSGIGWSPDGLKMAFLRTQLDQQWAAVVVANADGSDERVIARREQPLTFVTAAKVAAPVSRPAWSPDGREIVVVGYVSSLKGREPETELVFLDSMSGGEFRKHTTGQKPVRQAAWMSAGRLVLESSWSGMSTLGSTNLRGEEWSPLTRQFAALSNFSPTGDRQSAIAIRTERRTGVWVGNTYGENLRPLVPEDDSGFSCPYQDSAGNLFYSALRNDGGFGIYRVAANGGQPTLITSKLFGPCEWSVSSDGKIVVFKGRERPYPLFRVNHDGSGLSTLVDRSASTPKIMPDNQTVLFSVFVGPGLMSVGLAGGAARRSATSWSTVLRKCHRTAVKSRLPLEIMASSPFANCRTATILRS
jgi:dipeptidyl aminopeptidase/acylaminoacyl peptidase